MEYEEMAEWVWIKHPNRHISKTILQAGPSNNVKAQKDNKVNRRIDIMKIGCEKKGHRKAGNKNVNI